MREPTTRRYIRSLYRNSHVFSPQQPEKSPQFQGEIRGKSEPKVAQKSPMATPSKAQRMIESVLAGQDDDADPVAQLPIFQFHGPNNTLQTTKDAQQVVDGLPKFHFDDVSS